MLPCWDWTAGAETAFFGACAVSGPSKIKSNNITEVEASAAISFKSTVNCLILTISFLVFSE